MPSLDLSFDSNKQLQTEANNTIMTGSHDWTGINDRGPGRNRISFIHVDIFIIDSLKAHCFTFALLLYALSY